MTKPTLVLALLTVMGGTAAADVCYSMDESRDTLPPDDRRAAVISFGQALAKAGATVTNQNCTTTYTFYDVKLGDSITVYAIGPDGTREARANKIDELTLVYEQVAHSLVTGTPMGDLGNTDRTNATTDQMAPRRVAADNVKILRLGYGGVSGHTTEAGPMFGFGYRYELDHLAIEVSGFDVIELSDSSSRSAGVTMSLVRLGVLYYAAPLANDSFYYGGGIGYGFAAVHDNASDTDYSGNGLEGHVTAGYEMLRASTIRMFVEATANIPFYQANGTDSSGLANQRWIPSLGVQFGVGWGHSNAVNVVVR